MLRAKNKGALGKKLKDMEIKGRAQIAVLHAVRGEDHLESTGNFIFLATTTGEAWMLDHRENLALMLAEKGQPLDYQIKENSKQFSVKWSAKFFIKDDSFVAVKDGIESHFANYPLARLKELIENLQKPCN